MQGYKATLSAPGTKSAVPPRNWHAAPVRTGGVARHRPAAVRVGVRAPRSRQVVQVAFAFANSSMDALVPVATAETALDRKATGLLRYRFVVPQYVTSFGQSLKVVGSLPELGAWDAAKAPAMFWRDGHVWALELLLPPATFEFKVVVFEGLNTRWEGGNNRVVQAGEDDRGVPVEITIYLQCVFNATDTTPMQLAVPRSSVKDAYETGSATLEFLERRKAKVSGADPSQVPQAEAELVRLNEALAQQQSTVSELGAMLEHATTGSRGAFADEDEQLLLAIDAVSVPYALRRICFTNVAQQPALAAPSSSNLFLRGELDSRADELLTAAGELYNTLKASDSGAARSSLADLAEEASQVAAALSQLSPGSAAAHDGSGSSGGSAGALQLEQLTQLAALSTPRGLEAATTVAAAAAVEHAEAAPTLAPAAAEPTAAAARQAAAVVAAAAATAVAPLSAMATAIGVPQPQEVAVVEDSLASVELQAVVLELQQAMVLDMAVLDDLAAAKASAVADGSSDGGLAAAARSALAGAGLAASDHLLAVPQPALGADGGGAPEQQLVPAFAAAAAEAETVAAGAFPASADAAADRAVVASAAPGAAVSPQGRRQSGSASRNPLVGGFAAFFAAAATLLLSLVGMK